MIFRQLFDAESSTYTYLLGDEASGEAALIDSVQSQAERDAKLLRELGLELTLLLETHVHADHITGVTELKKVFPGARAAVSGLAGPECADIRNFDGDELKLGELRIRVLATPGHTAGCMSYLLGDRVFTGDTLLIRGCGRADFQGGDAGQLYDSITQKLFALPDATFVYPGHNYIGLTVSTIAEEKRLNPRLAGKSRAEFIEIMQNLKLPYPKKIDESLPANLKCGNLASGSQSQARSRPEPVGTGPEPVGKETAMTDIQQARVDEVQQMHEAKDPNQVWIDVRRPDEWEEGTIPGIERIVLDEFPDRIDTLDKSKTYVMVCRSGARSNRACEMLADAGFEHLINFNGGMLSWYEAGLPVE